MLLTVAFILAAQMAEPPTAAQYYAHAIEAMRDVPQPNFASYGVHVHVTGLGFMLNREPNGKASIDIGWGKGASKDASFSAAYRKSDDLTTVRTPQGWGVTSSPIFDPTWNGVNDWIRYGFNGRPDSATAPPLPAPDPNGLPEIAAVQTMGLAFYDAQDGGAATCGNGDAAHRIHLIARSDPLDHPLTDAVIDERTDRLCSVRLAMHQSVVAAGYSGTIDLNIEDVNGQSLVRNGTIDFLVRAMGIGVKHFTMRLNYDNFAFPATLAGDMFPGG
jgi:hypothetical protein